MQFFLVGIILLSILWRWPVVGLTIGITLLFGSWIVTWCISYYYDLVPLFVGITTATDYETYKNRLVLAWNLIYSKPYCRCGPYIIGILLAYIMYQNRNKNWNMKLIARHHYFVRGGFVGHRSRASSKRLSPHLPVGSLDSSGGQTGVALHRKLHVWASNLQRNRHQMLLFSRRDVTALALSYGTFPLRKV
ncbi:nose resistant to fluoxetine protein 6 [Trichonephila clavipes]|nr:nose resistant to fluoxetine protein 6 [Trichonephila clavipes]